MASARGNADRRVASWEEIDQLRRSIPERADWHLANWGQWRRSDHLTDGYCDHSVGLSTGGISGADAFEHLCEPCDEWSAEVSDAIISGLPMLYRNVLSNVYEAAVMTFRPGLVETVLIDAAAAFWVQARRRDLV